MKEKKEKKRWGLILFILIIMIGTSVSFVYYGFSGVDEKVKYNGITFVKFPERWEAKINGANAAFSFLPKEVEDIHVADDASQKLQNKIEIDFTSDLNSTYKESIALAQNQMELTLSAYNIFLRKGFTTSSKFDFAAITCGNATSIVPVVYFKYSNTTNIHAEGNCVIAEASSKVDFIRAKDRLLYGILGVMK